MKLIIDIPNRIFDGAKTNPNFYPTYDFEIIWKAIRNGITLDKIKTEIEKLDYLRIEDGSDGYDNYIDQQDVIKIINKC